MVFSIWFVHSTTWDVPVKPPEHISIRSCVVGGAVHGTSNDVSEEFFALVDAKTMPESCISCESENGSAQSSDIAWAWK